MDIFYTLNAIHSGTHSIQLWGWEGNAYRCQYWQNQPSQNSFYVIMPVELGDGHS